MVVWNWTRFFYCKVCRESDEMLGEYKKQWGKAMVIVAAWTHINSLANEDELGQCESRHLDKADLSSLLFECVCVYVTLVQFFSMKTADQLHQWSNDSNLEIININ